MKKKPTIIDISHESGFSTATVSRTLNEKSKIKTPTQKKILKIAKKLNYIPNFSAKYLVQGKSKSIGVLIGGNMPIYHNFFNYLEMVAIKKDYKVIVNQIKSNDMARQNDYIEHFLKLRMDGIIVFPLVNKGLNIFNYLDKLNIPYVSLNYLLDNPKKNCSVIFDFTVGMEEAVDDLLAQDKKNIHLITAPHIYYNTERQKIFQQLLQKKKISISKNVFHHVDGDIASAYELAKNLISKNQTMVDAFICSSDYIALGVMRALLELNKQIPKEIAVIGSYDIDIAKYLSPSLSTIVVDFQLCAEVVINKLIKIIDNKDNTKNVYLDTAYLKRETS